MHIVQTSTIATCLAILTALPSFAEETTARGSQSFIPLRLSEGTAQAIAGARGDLRAIQRAVTREQAEFQVPAMRDYIVRCILVGREVECRLEPATETDRCPDSIELTIPSVGTIPVEIDCEGPDRDGNCECEFAN